MPLPIAQKLAWSLATTLMVCVTLFKAADGYGVTPSTEFEGSPESVLHEYDPFA